MKKLVLVFAVAVGLVAMFAYAGDGKTCSMGGKNSAAHAKAMEQGKSVDMTGKLLCKHCNLHQSETCEKVFQPSDDEKTLLAVCEHSKVDLEKVSEEGAAVLHIKGKLLKCADSGKEELMIEEATKVPAATK